LFIDTTPEFKISRFGRRKTGSQILRIVVSKGIFDGGGLGSRISVAPSRRNVFELGIATG
jgi:hypothetical protein